MKLKSGEVVVDRHDSHLHESVVPYLPVALAGIESNGREFFIEEVDFGRQIGETICVATGPGDEIVYAQRPKRFGLTRFVKNRKPEPCSSVVVILKAMGRQTGTHVLITAYIGRKAEPEPWDRNATASAYEFWNSHALVWDCEEILPGTETDICPW